MQFHSTLLYISKAFVGTKLHIYIYLILYYCTSYRTQTIGRFIICRGIVQKWFIFKVLIYNWIVKTLKSLPCHRKHNFEHNFLILALSGTRRVEVSIDYLGWRSNAKFHFYAQKTSNKRILCKKTKQQALKI